MLKNIFKIFTAFSIIFSTSLFATDLIFPNYVKVDKVIPLKEDKIVSHTIEHCDYSFSKSRAFCSENAILFPKYISGKDNDQLAGYYGKEEGKVFFDEAEDICFTIDIDKDCYDKEQKDYKKVIYSYKNIAYSNGKTYIKYSKEPLWYINIKTKHFF